MSNLSPNQRHILGTYLLATECEKLDGKRWYLRANDKALAISFVYDVPFMAVVGVIAALSPNNRWDRNLRDAEGLIRLFTVGGRPACESLKVCTYGANKEKAIRILETVSNAFYVTRVHDGTKYLTDESEVGWHAGLHDMLAILKGPKVCEFASCILAAAWDGRSQVEWNTVKDAVCIDGHAFSIWHGQRIAINQTPKITPKVRKQIISDYVAVADHLTQQGEHVSPSQVQAVSWVTHRRIYGIR
jgi:hypothetical protein